MILTLQFFVVLDGTRADDLQILLHFMYRGEAYLHQDRINSVLRTAEALQVLKQIFGGKFKLCIARLARCSNF